MGGLCGARNTSEFHIQFVVEYNRFVTLFSRLRLSQLEARKLYTFFRSIDVDGSGHITLDEFKTKVKFENSPFASRVFTLFDYDKSGAIDFGEFVSVLWNFCTFTRYGLLALAFSLYDTDGSDTLSIAEIEEIIRQVYGIRGTIRDEKLVAALQAMSGDKVVRRDVVVSRSAFETFAVEHPSILEPALELQTELRQQVMGTPFWESLTVRRQGMSDMSTISDFVAQLKRDRAKTFGVTFSASSATAYVVSKRREEVLKRLESERAEHTRLFGDGTLQEGDGHRRDVPQAQDLDECGLDKKPTRKSSRRHKRRRRLKRESKTAEQSAEATAAAAAAEAAACISTSKERCEIAVAVDDRLGVLLAS